MFLPNKFMRYTAALRVYIADLILKNGIRPKYIENLRKIYNAEALFSKEEPLPYDLCDYLSNLLTAVYLLKAEQLLPFSFRIDIRGNFMLAIKPFCALILNLCIKAEKIEISKQGGRLIIKADCINKHSRKLTEKLKGCVYYERITKSSLIVLPISATDKRQTVITKTVEDYITDPFSIVNIYINMSF